MVKIDEYLNIPGKFTLADVPDMIINGNLSMDGKNVVFNCMVDSEKSQLLKRHNMVIYGQIEGKDITLLNAGCRNCRSAGIPESKITYFKIEPYEIILGKAFHEEPTVKRISANINVLVNMFSHSPLKMTTPSEENPSVLKYVPSDILTAEDDEGIIRLYQTFGLAFNRNKEEFPIIPCVEYVFHEDTLLMNAVAKIACARNLFSFFADYYISLENFTFSEEDNDTDHRFTLLLNHSEDIETKNELFIIRTDMFQSNFDIIWKEWCSLYKEALYIPTLFYEIICNRSTRINRFLNLVQAIDVYSVHYRDQEARAGSNKKKYLDEKNLLPLSFRIHDILTWLNDYIDLTADEIYNLSKNISDYRNYFTHFNPKLYVEPSFQEMSAASRILQFVLLAIIYKKVGISDEQIKNAKKYYSYGSLSNDLSIVLKKTNSNDFYYMFSSP